MQIYSTVSEAQKEPQLFRLEPNLFVLSFHVMKLMPALYILRKAFQEKSIDQRTLIVETSSGSFAYGIALACTELKLKFKVVSDNQMDPLLKSQLLNQNGHVLIVQKPLEKGGIQQARLNQLFEIMQEEPSSFWTCQYDNPANAESYFEIGHKLAATLGDDLILVGPVGSGGSTCGLISAIRKEKDSAKLVGVDTFNSVLFGQDDGPRNLPGLGNSILPKNLIHEKFDEVHWVSADVAIQATLGLHKQFGLFCGPTTGAAFLPAQWLARKYPNKNIVCISPDTGHRYYDSVYNPEWREKQGFCQGSYPDEPQEVHSPKTSQKSWAFLHWNRRALVQ